MVVRAGKGWGERGCVWGGGEVQGLLQAMKAMEESGKLWRNAHAMQEEIRDLQDKVLSIEQNYCQREQEAEDALGHARKLADERAAVLHQNLEQQLQKSRQEQAVEKVMP